MNKKKKTKESYLLCDKKIKYKFYYYRFVVKSMYYLQLFFFLNSYRIYVLHFNIATPFIMNGVFIFEIFRLVYILR